MYIIRTIIVLIVLFVLIAMSANRQTIAPTDEGKLNAFADEYNEYVSILKDKGIIDIAKWKRVQNKWDELK